METRGLSSAREREDNLFRRLFWPTVRNQYDVDLIGRRGFWLALVVGLLSSVVTLIQGQPLIALFTLVVFLLGAAGIRERSLPASVLIFAIYFIGVSIQWISAFVLGRPAGSPFVSLILSDCSFRAYVPHYRLASSKKKETRSSRHPQTTV